MTGEVAVLEVLATEDRDDREGEVVRPRPDGWLYDDDETEGCVK